MGAAVVGPLYSVGWLVLLTALIPINHRRRFGHPVFALLAIWLLIAGWYGAVLPPLTDGQAWALWVTAGTAVVSVAAACIVVLREQS